MLQKKITNIPSSRPADSSPSFQWGMLYPCPPVSDGSVTSPPNSSGYTVLSPQNSGVVTISPASTLATQAWPLLYLLEEFGIAAPEWAPPSSTLGGGGSSMRLLSSLGFPRWSLDIAQCPNLAQQRHEEPSSRSVQSLSTKQQGHKKKVPLLWSGTPILYPSLPLLHLRPSSRVHCRFRDALPPTRQTLTLSCRTRSFPVYSRAETWLPLCINKKHITKHFPQNASSWPLAHGEVLEL